MISLDLKINDFRRQIEKDYKDKGLKQFWIYPYNKNYIKLDTIIIDKPDRKQGIGTEILKKLTDLADKLNLGIVLTTAVKNKEQGTTSASRLKDFYKRFGFVENKGKSMDYSVSGNMIRHSKKPQTQEQDTDTDNQKTTSELDKLLKQYSDVVYETLKEIEKEAKSDEKSKQMIADMKKKALSPILNGMDLKQLMGFKDREKYKEPIKKYIKQMIIYIEAHLDNFINNKAPFVKALNDIQLKNGDN